MRSAIPYSLEIKLSLNFFEELALVVCQTSFYSPLTSLKEEVNRDIRQLVRISVLLDNALYEAQLREG